MPIRLLNTDRTTIEPFTVSALGKGVKPFEAGLWYGFGESWLEWSSKHLPQMIRSNLFELELDESRILKLSTLAECLAFTNKYGEENGFMPSIDWDKVAKDWAGVEVTPECMGAYTTSTFSGSSDKKLMWLMSWDVASGCVWDSSAIRDSKKIPETDTRVVNLRSQILPSRP